MQVEEVGSLLVDGFLETRLGGRAGWKIADSAGGGFVLHERVCESFADFGCFGDFCGSGRVVGVPVRELDMLSYISASPLDVL